MGGSPRSAKKPGPSYDDGRLRDPSVEAAQDKTYNPAALQSLIKKAARAPRQDPHST